MGKSKHSLRSHPLYIARWKRTSRVSMAILHKSKLFGLATHCTVSGSHAQSPTRSPVIHSRRRRKTLRMLLSGAADRHRRFPDGEAEIQEDEDPPEKRVRRKLKDLFVSSPPFEDKDNNRDSQEVELLPVTGTVRGGGNGGFAGRRGGAGTLRAVSTTLRHRLLKRPWRPVLVTIPE